MTNSTTSTALLSRRQFSLENLIFVALWLAVAAFIAQEFGLILAVILSLLLPLPLAIAIYISRRGRAVRRSDFLLLVVVQVLVFGVMGVTVRSWYADGLHHIHEKALGYAEFGRILDQDPAFRNVHVNVTPKNIAYMRGTVASKADRDRLVLLAKRYVIGGSDEIEIAP